MEKYKWTYLESIEEARQRYKFKELKELVLSDLQLKDVVKIQNWEKLYDFIKAMKFIMPKEESLASDELKDNIQEEKYFISKEHELAFYILNSEKGFDRELGITKRHYVDNSKAKEWRNKYIKIFHPDKNRSDLDLVGISAKVTKIYKRMVGEA